MSDQPFPYLDHLVIRDFRCVKEATIDPSPLHAFVGPNDSGKSTILRFVDEGLRLRSWRSEMPYPVGSLIRLGSDLWYVGPLKGKSGIEFSVVGPKEREVNRARAIRRAVRTVRLDPDEMRKPTELLATGAPLTLSERGLGLGAVIDAIMSRDLSAFLQLRDGFLKRFPTVRELGQANVTSTTKAVQIVLRDGTVVPAKDMSEGMLYWLGFAVQQIVDPASVLLVEEPENGLHPHRIAEVVKILRDLSERGTQVLIATHSPLVINELQGHEVSVVTRSDDHGTQVVRLDQTPHYAERSKVYQNGELWLAHADGVAERELVGPS